MNPTHLETLARKYRVDGFLDEAHLENLKEDLTHETLGSQVSFQHLSISQQSSIEEVIQLLLDGNLNDPELFTQAAESLEQLNQIVFLYFKIVLFPYFRFLYVWNSEWDISIWLIS